MSHNQKFPEGPYYGSRYPKLKKPRGGLGILNLGSQNVALLIKHANNFLNKKDLPWVSLIWDTYYHNRVPQGTSDCRNPKSKKPKGAPFY